MIDIASRSVMATVPLGTSPTDVVISPDDSELFVADLADNTVTVLDATLAEDGIPANETLATIAVGTAPGALALSPDGGTLLVAEQQDDTVSVVNVSTRAVIDVWATVDLPFDVAFHPTGTTAYVLDPVTQQGILEVPVAAADTSAPAVLDAGPVDRAGAVLQDSPIEAVFSEEMDVTTFNTTNVQVLDALNVPIAGTLAPAGNGVAVTFTPDAGVRYALNSTVNVVLGTGLTDAAGNALPAQALLPVPTISMQLPDLLAITVDLTTSGIEVNGVAGAVEPDSLVTVTNQTTMQSFTTTAAPDGSFSVVVLGLDTDGYELVTSIFGGRAVTDPTPLPVSFTISSPDAGLITYQPGPAGTLLAVGAAGAVDPQSSLVLIRNLTTSQNFQTTTVAPDGSFSLGIFASSGDSLDLTSTILGAITLDPVPLSVPAFTLPTLDFVTPDRFIFGDPVTLVVVGTDFGTVPANILLQVGGQVRTDFILDTVIGSPSQQAIVVDLAGGAQSGQVNVTVAGQSSNILDYFAETPPNTSPFAEEVIASSGASNTAETLGASDGVFSDLGVAGSITLRLGSTVEDGPGNDLQVFENTADGADCYGVLVSASSAGPFDSLGTFCGTAFVDLAAHDPIRFVRLVDANDGLPTAQIDGVFAIRVKMAVSVVILDSQGAVVQTLLGPTIAIGTALPEATVVDPLTDGEQDDISATTSSRFRTGMSAALASPIPGLTDFAGPAVTRPADIARNGSRVLEAGDGDSVAVEAGHSITLALARFIRDRPGADFSVVEDDSDGSGCYRIHVSHSSAGPYSEIGQFCGSHDVDLAGAGKSRFVRIIGEENDDRSVTRIHSLTVDGRHMQAGLLLSDGSVQKGVLAPAALSAGVTATITPGEGNVCTADTLSLAVSISPPPQGGGGYGGGCSDVITWSAGGGGTVMPTSGASSTFTAPMVAGRSTVSVSVNRTGNCQTTGSDNKTINVDVNKVDLVGHQTSTRTTPGAAVAEADEDDPNNLFGCVNDDFDDGNPLADNGNTVIGATDDDIVRLTLKKLQSKKGTVTLSVSPSANVRLFNNAGSAPVSTFTVDLASPSGDLMGLAFGDLFLFLEGITPSPDVTVKMEYKSTTSTCSDEVHIVVPKTDFDVKQSQSSDPAETVLAQDKEESDGLLLAENDDDDDENGVHDNADILITGTAMQQTEDKKDLATLTLQKLEPSTLASGNVFLKKLDGPGNVRVFKKSDGSHILTTSGATSSTSSAQASALFTTLKAGTETYSLEGVDPGALTLALELNDGTKKCGDPIKITVVNVDLDAKKAKFSDAAEPDIPDEKEETEGLILAVNDDDDDVNGSPDNGDMAITGTAAQQTKDKEDMSTLTLQRLNPNDLMSGQVFVKKLKGTGNVRIFNSSDGSEVLKTSGATASTTAAQANALFTALKAGTQTYKMEGVDPGELTLALEFRDGNAIVQDKLVVTVAKLDLDSDLDINTVIDDNDELFEETRGAYIVVNNDDDDRDGTVDTADGQVVSGVPAGSVDENNLKRFNIANILPASLQTDGKVVLSRSDGRIRVYSDPKKGTAAANDKQILWSATVAGFAQATEGNGKKTWDLAVGAEKTEFQNLVTNGLFVEGLGSSAALLDSALFVSYTSAAGGTATKLDEIKITVIEFQDITATVPPTPANTLRPPAPAPADHTFVNAQAGIVYYLDENTTNRDSNFDTPHALVLVRRNADSIPLVLTHLPAAAAIRWQVDRSMDDAAGLGGGTPALATTPAGADLGMNKRGSFLVSAYVDANANNVFDNGEPRVYLPYILIDIALNANNTATHSGNVALQFQGVCTVTGGACATNADCTGGADVCNWVSHRATTGMFNIATPATAGIYLAGDVDFTGGGPNGRRGMDRVFGGWINNTSQVVFDGAYTNGHRFVSVLASNVPGDGAYDPGDPAPVLVAGLLCDTGRQPGGGTGGELATLTRSTDTRTVANIALGQRRTVEAVDSPGVTFGRFHRNFPTDRLTNVAVLLDFSASLSIWTNATAARGATADAANRLYSVALSLDWTVRASWSVSATGAVAPVIAPAIATANVTNHIGANGPARARDTGVEVRLPTSLNSLGFDARN
ncbi:MAG: Ig-like domain-containing protein [Acidobacteriota bacterium]